MMRRPQRPGESDEEYRETMVRALTAWREMQGRHRNRKDQEASPPVEKSTPIQRIKELYEQRKPEPSSVLSDVFGQRLRDLANITYLDPETGRRSGDRPVLPTGLNAFLPVGARPNSAADLSGLSVAMKPNPFSNEILKGLAFNPEGEEMENMMGFRPLRYANGTGPQGVTSNSAEIEMIGNAIRNVTNIVSKGSETDVKRIVEAERPTLMKAVEMGFPGSDFIGNLLQMYPPDPSMQPVMRTMDMPAEGSGLGMGVTQNPGFNPQMQTYSPPERRANGGIMSLRVR